MTSGGGGSALDPVFSSSSLVPSQGSLKRLRWTSLFRISSLPYDDIRDTLHIDLYSDGRLKTFYFLIAYSIGNYNYCNCNLGSSMVSEGFIEKKIYI